MSPSWTDSSQLLASGLFIDTLYHQERKKGGPILIFIAEILCFITGFLKKFNQTYLLLSHHQLQQNHYTRHQP